MLIRAQLWADATEGVEIKAMITDFDFQRDKRFPFPIRQEDGSNAGVSMDALLGIKRAAHLGKDKQYLVELETGSNEPAAVRRKVYNLVKFVSYFERVFGTQLLSGYLFFATATYGIKEGKPRYASPDDHR